MKNKIVWLLDFWGDYYPIILVFFHLYSVSLWFSGQKLEGIFVGIWVPLYWVFLLQLDREEETEKKNFKMSTPVPFSMFVIGLIVFILYLSGYVYMIIKASNQQKEELANDPELQEYNKKKER